MNCSRPATTKLVLFCLAALFLVSLFASPAHAATVAVGTNPSGVAYDSAKG
ncbi:MAG: hypothetical protein ABSF83_14220 [Nitrososphaerales archaeon]|jgi:hypothetical protein